jgi:gamma-glutamylcysteine synthetase
MFGLYNLEMTKYREYYQKMVNNNKKLFEDFQRLHDRYVLDEEKWQDKFNEEGEKILDVVREYENKLCSQSEKGGYSNFTPKLAEKFREEIKKHFSMIEHIGIKVEVFALKKIKLS